MTVTVTTLSEQTDSSDAFATTPDSELLESERRPEKGHSWMMATALILVAAFAAGLWIWRERARHETRASVSPDAPGVVSGTAENFSVLFNNRDLTGWSGDTNVWSVQDGVIHARSGRRAPRTAWCLFWKEEVGDFELRLRFRRWSGNSGIFYRAKALSDGAGGYQFDIASGITGNLLETGSDRTRRELFRVRAGSSSMDSGWHEVVITASGPRLSHQLDGVTLCEINDASPDAPQTGFIGLEASSDTIVDFKDIRLKRLGPASPAATPGRDWITLFDGNSLAAWQGWNGDEVNGAWRLTNGELCPARGVRVNLATRERFGDFELELEWKASPGANSGIFYRAVTSRDPIPQTSPEYQVVDDSTADGRKPITAAGSIYGVVAPSNKRLQPVGEFNLTRIVVKGPRVEHWLNG